MFDTNDDIVTNQRWRRRVTALHAGHRDTVGCCIQPAFHDVVLNNAIAMHLKERRPSPFVVHGIR